MSVNTRDKSTGTIVGLVAEKENEGSVDTRLVRSESANVNADSRQAGSGQRNIHINNRLRAADMLVPGSRLGPTFHDEYRRIKRPLLSNAFGKSASLVDRGNLILVTSSIPGEGKTYTAVNLALSIANEQDHTVLLVDCDVVKQGATRMLGLSGKPGLVDLLENSTQTIGDVLLRTDVDELTVLCAGSKQHDYVTELLASQRMSDLVAEMVDRYEDRVIIFDGPPVLPTPQTQVLSGLVGQIVFVIEAGKTPQIVVDEALDMLPEDKAIGLVMNKTEGVQGHSGYYYGYYGSDSSKKK